MAHPAARALVAVLLLALATSAQAAGLIPIGGQPTSFVINPVTNQIFLKHGGAFANQVTRLDVATQAITTVTLAGSGGGLTVDVLRNRVYAGVGGGNFVAIDGATLATTPFSVPGGALALDAGANRLYSVRPNGVYVLDGATLTSQFVPYNGTGASAWGGSAVDPVSNLLQVVVEHVSDLSGDDVYSVQRIGGDPPAVIDAVEVARAELFPTSLAINPYSSQSYVFDPYNNLMSRVDWTANAVASNYMNELATIALVDLTADRFWIWRPGDFHLEPGGGARIRPDTLAFDGGVGMNTDSGWVMNPATRRHYAGRVFEEAPRHVASIHLDTPFTSTMIPGSDVNEAGVIRVNPATNRLYRIHVGAMLAEYDELVATPVPMPTTITPGTPLPTGEVTVEFAATSSWLPINHPVRRIYYQVDSIHGEWLPASPEGGVASATITGLAAGAHTIHALATDGQESPMQPSHTLATGPIASAEITVPAPSTCANGADDDGDGLADHPADPGCRDAAAMLENPRCDDELDNDGDGNIDWDGGSGAATPDAQCVANSWRNSESPTACGFGAELALAFAALRWRLRRSR